MVFTSNFHDTRPLHPLKRSQKTKLRKEEEKKSQCKYCNATNNDFIPLNDTVDYSGIEMSLNRQGVLRVRYYDINDPDFVTQDIVNIKYCPMCGGKIHG